MVWSIPNGMVLLWYVPKNGTMVLEYVSIHVYQMVLLEYHGTRVPWYVHVYQMVLLEYPGTTMVRTKKWCHGTYGKTWYPYVPCCILQYVHGVEYVHVYLLNTNFDTRVLPYVMAHYSVQAVPSYHGTRIAIYMAIRTRIFLVRAMVPDGTIGMAYTIWQYTTPVY